jgi:hypothetical protein
MANQDIPLGVLLLAGLQGLQALVLLLPGLFLMIIPIIGWIIGVPMIAIGLFLMFIAWGLFTMQSWAWLWALVMNIIGLIVSLFGANWLGVILSLIIVLYLNQSDIRNRFR